MEEVEVVEEVEEEHLLNDRLQPLHELGILRQQVLSNFLLSFAQAIFRRK